MTKKLIVSLLVGAAMFAAPALAQAPSATHSASIKNAAGAEVATAEFSVGPNGTLIVLTFNGEISGTHGLHLHTTGACVGPTFETAGGHLNPDGSEHGFFAANGPHLGDLPNVHVDGSGHMVEIFVAGLDEATLMDGDGTAIVIHMQHDDHATNPSGASGDRIACGVIG